MIAPPLLPTDWASTADKLNLTEGSRFVEPGCDTGTALYAPDGVAALDPGLRIGPVESRGRRSRALGPAGRTPLVVTHRRRLGLRRAASVRCGGRALRDGAAPR